ncbi:Methyltransferase domain-containing protein [Lentibacillus halodurans]|uniref:Methyltransferase domain-containing protein n=1 Tax=Lentibacillus halodurans TaxID=237679 RepID=A0A1I0XUM8_9BACI|nr:class I SAM-dependent methyltransferase [Lentibacillus halodurans]SFB04839.1 Methyltransferase domain-containing protein [Lentibacillus halodurans]
MSQSFNWHKEAEVQWDNRAEFWNERSKEMWDRGSRKQIVPFIEKHLEKGSSIVDVGCGDGYGSYKLHKSGYNVTGVDISGEMIKLAKKRLYQEDIAFLQGDITSLPMCDASQDSMMAINVIEWTASPVDVLKELGRVLKKDGLLFAGILGPTAGPRMNSYPRLHGEKAICNTMMPWEFQQLASELHFEYMDGLGVFKKEVNGKHYEHLPLDLQQALTFMWVFLLRKAG